MGKQKNTKKSRKSGVVIVTAELNGSNSVRRICHNLISIPELKLEGYCQLEVTLPKNPLDNSWDGINHFIPYQRKGKAYYPQAPKGILTLDLTTDDKLEKMVDGQVLTLVPAFDPGVIFVNESDYYGLLNPTNIKTYVQIAQSILRQ